MFSKSTRFHCVALAAAGLTVASSCTNSVTGSDKAERTLVATTALSSSLLKPGQTYSFRTSCADGLHVMQASGVNNGEPITLGTDSNSAAQRFGVIAQADGTITLVNSASNRVVDVAAASLDNGSPLIGWDAHGGPNQRFVAQDVGNGLVTFLAQHSGKAIDLAGAQVTENAVIHQWEPNGTCAQQWKPVATPSQSSICSADLFPPRANVRVQYPVGTVGVFNVRDYGAVGDGVTDDTAAFKAAFKAIDDLPFQRPNWDFSKVYVPDGTYLLSDTISFTQYRSLQGESELGTRLVLKDNAPGFEAGQNKPMVRCLFNNNQSFANYVRNLTIDTGKGNAGAVGLRYNTHNTGTVEHVTIRSGDGSGPLALDLTETEFGPGLIKNVRIEGFDVGIRTTGLPSHATLAHIELAGQRVAGIQNAMPLSIQDLRSDNAVPVFTSVNFFLAQSVIVDAKLCGRNGGPAIVIAVPNGGPAGEISSGAYLSGVTTEGYSVALRSNDVDVPGLSIDSFVQGEQFAAFASARQKHLNLSLTTVPEVFEESPSQWVIPDDSAADDTAAVQAAFDSGAQTIFFPFGKTYTITDTVIVRGNVKRILGMFKGGLGGRIEDFTEKPMMRIAGNGSTSVTVESLSLSTYPYPVKAIEVASANDVYLKFFNGPIVTNAPAANGAPLGRLFLDEALTDLRLSTKQSVQVRQFNTENNPYNFENPPPLRTYVELSGIDMVVLGWKTEAPALHARLINGSQLSVLGGFTRDFTVTNDIPFWNVTDSALTATIYNYDNTGCGHSRTLHATETRQGETRQVTTSGCAHNVGLLSAAP
jgi:Pectate lyase superfamily protein/Ricin-type beta-trefoil lectin domain-like